VLDVQPTPCTSLELYLTGGMRETFMNELQPDVAAMAKNIASRVRLHVTIDVDDLTQEGMLAAWRALNRADATKLHTHRSLVVYCIKAARGAMFDHLSTYHRALSLDTYLVEHDIEETPHAHNVTSLATRRRILAAMRALTERQRAVCMCAYRIETRNGEVYDRASVNEQFHLNKNGYS
jgi:RNA polymerase sigma factor (sigma-70 family)